MRLIVLVFILISVAFPVELKVYAVVVGKVAKVYVREGQKVSKGTLLMEIDPSLYVAKREILLGKRKEIEARLWKVERDYRRLKELFDRDLLAETRLEDKKVEYETLKAQLQQVDGELKRIDTLISYTKIVSPVGGEVVRILAPEGSYVNGKLTPQPVVTIKLQKTSVE